MVAPVVASAPAGEALFASRLRQKLDRATSEARALLARREGRGIDEPVAAEEDPVAVGRRMDRIAKKKKKKKTTTTTSKPRRRLDKETAAFHEALREAHKLLGKKAMGSLVAQYAVPLDPTPRPVSPPLLPTKKCAAVELTPAEQERMLERRVTTLVATREKVDRCAEVVAKAKDKHIADQDKVIFLLKTGLEVIADMARHARVAACERALRLRVQRLSRPPTPSFLLLLRNHDLAASHRALVRADDVISRAHTANSSSYAPSRWSSSSSSSYARSGSLPSITYDQSADDRDPTDPGLELF